METFYTIYPIGFILTDIFLIYYCYDEDNTDPTFKELLGILGLAIIWPLFWVYFIYLHMHKRRR